MPVSKSVKMIGVYINPRGGKDKQRYYYKGKVNSFVKNIIDESFYGFQIVFTFNQVLIKRMTHGMYLCKWSEEEVK